MADHKLSTSDLAGTSDSDASDAPGETKEGKSDQNALTEAAREGRTHGEMASADEPSARERSEIDEHADDPLARPRGDRTSEQAEPESGSAARTQPGAAASDPPAGERSPLLPDDQTERFTERWQEIQTAFVDEP